jgi:hypothetical protein
LFDDDYRKKLDHRKYVCPSRDQVQPPPPEELATESTTKTAPALQNTKEPETTKSRANKFADDEELELDEDDSENDDAEIPEGSLFEYNVPGILSKDSVSNLDLAHWKLVVRTSLVELEVAAHVRAEGQR